MNISDIGNSNDFGCRKWFSIHLVYKNILVSLHVYYYRKQFLHVLNSQRFKLLPSAPYLDRSVPGSCLLYGGLVHNLLLAITISTVTPIVWSTVVTLIALLWTYVNLKKVSFSLFRYSALQSSQLDQTIGQRFHGIYKGNIVHLIVSLERYLTHANTLYRHGQFVPKMIVKCRLT